MNDGLVTEADGMITLQLNLDPVPLSAHTGRVRVREFAMDRGIDACDIDDFMFAVGEALANAIEHSQTREPIEVTVQFRGDQLFTTVTDRGIGFRTQIAGTAELPPPGEERGRGMPIMRSFADVFAIRSEDGRGTSVILGRYLRGGEILSA